MRIALVEYSGRMQRFDIEVADERVPPAVVLYRGRAFLRSQRQKQQPFVYTPVSMHEVKEG